MFVKLMELCFMYICREAQSKLYLEYFCFELKIDKCMSLNVGLTHCGLVMPYGDIDLGQHWLR